MQELENNGIEGIVPSHGDIMAVLFHVEKCTMKELSHRINRTKATVTVLVNKLESNGFLVREKSAEDSRITFITLTKKGKSLKPVFEDISEKLNKTTYMGLSKQESEELEFLLEKVLQNFT